MSSRGRQECLPHHSREGLGGSLALPKKAEEGGRRWPALHGESMSLNAVGRSKYAVWVLAARVLARVLSAAAAVNLAPRVEAQRLVLGNDPAARADGDPAQGVYVRDSAIASDKFELGKRMERLKEWHKSADVYQEILKTYKDRVVPTDNDGMKAPTRYASVRQAV